MLPAGHQLGPYIIISTLGSGGMGEVYLADDTRLRRRVAIKVLPAELAADDLARKRLFREALAIAALDHPNICTVYEAGDADGHSFIAMQYVEGDTLAARLKRGSFDVAAAVTIARQVAEALAEAHRHGVVHRDIKPQNIMLSRLNQARVLDFGLATPTTPLTDDAQTATALSVIGVAAGTVPYMSPEQARAEPIDERSDIFSLGTVLYEIVARAHPFSAGSQAETISGILTRVPSRLDLSVPSEVRRIISKCLEKNRERRYQTARDLAIDLDSVAKELAAPADDPAMAGERRPAQDGPVWRRPVIWIGAAVVVTLSVVAAALLTPEPPSVPSSADYEQLTDFADSATAPSLSSDGRMVTFIRGGPAFQSRGQIYVKLLPNGTALQLTDDPRPKYGPVFTPDGTRVAYTLMEPEGSIIGWNTWTVPVTGGPPTRLLPNASGLSWIDDRHVLFSEIRPGTALHMGLVTATETRAASREIFFPAHERAMVHYSSTSPDRQWLLAVEMDRAQAWQQCRLLPFDGRSAGRPVGPPGACMSAAWSPDGQWMYFSVRRDGTSHLWRQRFPDGPAEAITSGVTTEEEGVAPDPSGQSIVTSIGRRRSSVWWHDSAGDRQLSAEGFAFAPRVSLDGKRVYYLLRPAASASADLFVFDLASGRTDRVLPGFPVLDYEVSQDEKDVAFTAVSHDGESRIWIAALDRRSAPREVARGGDNVAFGADRDLVFRSLEGHVNYLDRIGQDGTKRTRLSSQRVLNLEGITPDGRWALVSVPVSGAESASETIAVPVYGGQAITFCSGVCDAAWSPDGRWMFLTQGLSWRSQQAIAVPVSAGRAFPQPPAGGWGVEALWSKLPGARTIDRANFVMGLDPSRYVFVKTDELRNLFRVPIR